MSVKKATKKPVKKTVKQIEAPKNNQVPMIPETQTDMLVRLAADPHFPVEKLTALIDLKNREEERQARKDYDFHFSDMQAELPTIPKSKQGYKYKYAPLEEILRLCRPILARHHFAVSFAQETLSNTRLKIICSISGWGFEKQYPIEINVISVSEMTNENQDIGSAKSYARRYAIMDALGIVGEDEDDDGVSSMPSHKEQKKDYSEYQNPLEKPASKKPICPKCGVNKDVIVSKWPDKGAYYCMSCKNSFDAFREFSAKLNLDDADKKAMLAEMRTAGTDKGTLENIRLKYQQISDDNDEAEKAYDNASGKLDSALAGQNEAF